MLSPVDACLCRHDSHDEMDQRPADPAVDGGHGGQHGIERWSGSDAADHQARVVIIRVLARGQPIRGGGHSSGHEVSRSEVAARHRLGPISPGDQSPSFVSSQKNHCLPGNPAILEVTECRGRVGELESHRVNRPHPTGDQLGQLAGGPAEQPVIGLQ